MKVITQGHLYSLDNFEEGSGAYKQHADQARQLCYAIEELPASEQQTKVSLAASAMHSNLLAGDQTIQFIEKRPYPHAPNGESTTQLETVNNGTTNEDVLRVLIDRLNYLNGKFPCRENSVALTHIETALMWLEKRTRDRVARGVEGKNQK